MWNLEQLQPRFVLHTNRRIHLWCDVSVEMRNVHLPARLILFIHVHPPRFLLLILFVLL